jgi:hypothetical protein
VKRDITMRLERLEAANRAADLRPTAIWLVGVDRDENGELVEVSRSKIPLSLARRRRGD